MAVKISSMQTILILKFLCQSLEVDGKQASRAVAFNANGDNIDMTMIDVLQGTSNRHSALSRGTSLHAIAASDASMPRTVSEIDEASACSGGRDREYTILTQQSQLPEAYLIGMRRNRIAYAKKHGYEYCEFDKLMGQWQSARQRTGVANETREARMWSKVAAVASLLRSGRKAVFWIDADALFMNHNISIEDIASKYRDGHDAIFTRDAELDATHGLDERADVRESTINTGVFIIYNTKWSQGFVKEWAEVQQNKDYLSTMHWNASMHGFMDYDQGGLLFWRHQHLEDFARHVSVIPGKIMNSAWRTWLRSNFRYQPGDFVIHTAGSKHKYERMLQILLRNSSCALTGLPEAPCNGTAPTGGFHVRGLIPEGTALDDENMNSLLSDDEGPRYMRHDRRASQ